LNNAVEIKSILSDIKVKKLKQRNGVLEIQENYEEEKAEDSNEESSPKRNISSVENPRVIKDKDDPFNQRVSLQMRGESFGTRNDSLKYQRKN
jgi:hypothetical protein